MKTEQYQTRLLIFSFTIHAMTLAQFLLNPFPREIYAGFLWQFYLLLGLSFASSALIFNRKKGYPFFLSFQLLTILLIAYPTGGYIWIGALLMTVLTVETALLTPEPSNRLLALLPILPLVFFQQDRSAFYTEIRGAAVPDLLILIFLPLLAGQAACFHKKKETELARMTKLNKRLDLAASRLIDANLGYQNYAKQLESRTLDEERRRISREIHDSVGYSLTNVRVMLEAGGMQIDTAPDQAKDLISRAMEETRICLEETRTAMRELREREKPDYRGLMAVNRLIRAFEESTGIEVTIEYGEAPSQFPAEIDKIVYRLIQEAMTNSFRHGMASRVDIMFWYEQGLLQILVRDNGRGGSSIKEGIGLTGMRERVENAGGTVTYGNGESGFEIRAELPLKPQDDREKEGKEQKDES